VANSAVAIETELFLLLQLMLLPSLGEQQSSAIKLLAANVVNVDDARLMPFLESYLIFSLLNWDNFSCLRDILFLLTLKKSIDAELVLCDDSNLIDRDDMVYVRMTTFGSCDGVDDGLTIERFVLMKEEVTTMLVRR